MQSKIISNANRRLIIPKAEAEAHKKNKLRDERPTSNNDVAPLFKLF